MAETKYPFINDRVAREAYDRYEAEILPEVGLSMEELNARNMIIFWGDEIREAIKERDNGIILLEGIEKPASKCLIRLGVIKRYQIGRCAGTRYKLAPYAIEILKL